MVKKGFTAVGLLLTQQILYLRTLSRITSPLGVNISDALRDLIPFIQFKKREKHPARIITFSNAWNMIT